MLDAKACICSSAETVSGTLYIFELDILRFNLCGLIAGKVTCYNMRFKAGTSLK